MQSALRSLVEELSATCLRLFAYIGVVAVIVVVAARLLAAPVLDAPVAAPRNPWIEVERPMPAFGLTVPEFPQPEPDYAIHRHTEGGGRRDVMSFGAPWETSSTGSRLMIEVYRPGRELHHFGDPATEIAARAAKLGGPHALRQADGIDSKFGRFAAYDFTAQSGETRHRCLGFAHADKSPLLEIAGWYCKGGDEVVDRAVPGCALERLSLLMAASEPKVIELFAKAERKRKPCAAKAPAGRRVSNTRRHDWINGPKGPKLRGRMAAR